MMCEASGTPLEAFLLPARTNTYRSERRMRLEFLLRTALSSKTTINAGSRKTSTEAV